MITIKSTDNIADLEQQWKAAKEAEKGWNDHRLLIEGQVLEIIPQETFVTTLPDKGKIRLDGTDITFAQRRTFNQGKLAALIAEHPWLLQTLFEIEYKCTSNPKLDAFLTDNQEEIGKRLRECFEDKASKPSFSAR